MNFYIQGSAARAKEIKAAFENLGYDTRAFDYSCGLFVTLNSDRCVHYLTANRQFVDIIKTHPDYKELGLPAKPKFKVGDNIKTGNQIDTIAEIDNYTQRYYCESGRTISFANQDLWKLDTKPHYDISSFYAGMPVLERSGNYEHWDYNIFSRYLDNNCSHPFILVGCHSRQCIPFKGNEPLLGATDMPDNFYINW